ncbi:ABC transporter permease [bacterium]|nr:MAG: ABC transporter permease [bacterium]
MNSYKTLLKQLVVTDYKLRYQGSILGYLWSLLKPLMLFGVLFIVFSYVIPLGKGVPHFPVYLLLGIVVWTFFTEATSMGLNAIVGRGDLIRKVKISKPTIVLSAVISAGVNFTFNLIVVAVFMIINQVDVHWSMIWIVPLLVIELLALAMGLAFLLAALYVKFRDMGPIWEVLLQMLFYATPIIYPLTLVTSHNLATIISLSPLAQIIQDLRYILVTQSQGTTHAILDVWYLQIIPFAIVALVLVIGVWYFRKRANYFVEDL